MEREANYVAVGAFVLLITAMAVLFVYWYSDTRDQRSFTSALTSAAWCASGSIRAPPAACR